ncbi:hypothetical protein [Corallococcus sp. Z5C101001]|uniref:hypothetical protein n=1 Tax=Corallococcus sp. Z5C101001 TaxID=2596829 RepID=UPI00117CB415|nr:hypothetical protein [Corallococcus sp. Z5C101001]TSC26508.1 hypothetical protein FOF48_20690 [Corallococcus sp. Z5C101001]
MPHRGQRQELAYQPRAAEPKNHAQTTTLFQVREDEWAVKTAARTQPTTMKVKKAIHLRRYCFHFAA